MVKVCLECSGEYSARQKTQKYCSRKCKHKFESKNRVWTEEEKAANNLRSRKRYILSNYGMTYDDYLEFVSSGVCEICGKNEEENGRVLSVDHCHSSNQVRGLLCDDCNKGLGMFRDNPELLEKAQNYLKGSVFVG